MASSSDVVKKVMRFKVQLTDTAAESATVIKILQKLQNLDITVDILAETGIGKTVNSLRRHEQAGEFAKTLVRSWKKLLAKGCTSLTEDGAVSDSLSVQDKRDNTSCQNAAGLTTEDLNNNYSCHGNNQGVSDEAHSKTGIMKADSEKQGWGCKERNGRNKGNRDKIQPENQNNFQSDVSQKKMEKHEMDGSFAPKKKNCWSESKLGDNNVLHNRKKSEDIHQRSRSDSREKLKINIGPETESSKKSTPSKEGEGPFSFECNDKYSKTFKLDNLGDEKSSRSSKGQKKKRKKASKERRVGLQQKSDNEEHSQHKNKKAKIKHTDKEREDDRKEPSKSFESCLNYDVAALKRKEQCGAKKTSKKFKTVAKEESRKDPDVKPPKSHEMFIAASPPKQKSVMDLMNISLPTVLSECEKPSTVVYYDRKVEKEVDFCGVSEESAIFTGQRLNKKMQVYSGAKMVFLPSMLSLYQQCIRTLQNNINLLHETGGVPFEILEPVLERCTPEQLLRIEECNPIYIGVTDHLWGKHCQREFKDSQLQEYESWKEMYVRLSEERERKLQRLTQSIVSAHSKKPKGRQVKMAFIHTVAKPPRDVRIQQEIHGTAVQQPNQLRCSVKPEDNTPRPSCNEPSRFSSSSSGGGNSQDSRKKTRVAPMMAKSLKAFKKQLGRR